MNELSPAQVQRFRFIEARLLWEGALQRKDLCTAFALTLNHVTREITNYRDRYPGNLTYDPGSRTWRAADGFMPHHASGAAEEYLELLLAFSLSGDPSIMAGTGPAVPVQTLPALGGVIGADVLRPLVAAIGHQQGLDIVYQSFSEPEPRRRTICPHSLVYALSRWHVRAYDDRKERFADFVLSRVLDCSQPTAPDGDNAAPAKDLEWHQMVVVDVQPGTHLSITQQAVIAKQYGMSKTKQGWKRSAKIRRCLVKYFLHQHRLDVTAGDTGIAHISLCDPTLIEKHSFQDD